MDTHTLELLEFDRIRRIVAGYAACSLGKGEALRMEPSTEPGVIRERLALTTEMTEALMAGLSPPMGGVHDIRANVRRAQTGATLDADELAEAVEVLNAIERVDRWLAKIGDEFPRLGGLKGGVGEFSGVAGTISGCLDERGNILDTASRRLSALRREIQQVEERIQETLRRMLRSPDIKRILRYPNFTMVGHHYVLPIAKDHRGEIQGSVHRTSASNETVYVEPQAIAEQSAQLSYLRAKEAKEIRRILRWLSAQIGQVADSLLETLETLAELDFVFARGRYSLDYRMTAPDLNPDGPFAVRGARHPLLEALVRERKKRPAAEPSSVSPSPPGGEGRVRGDAPVAEPDTALSPQAPPHPNPLPQWGEGEKQGEEEGEPREGAKEAIDAPRQPRSLPPALRFPDQVVPIDIHLGLRFRMLVITGPNTGGKTVALKTIGLLAVMAQCGLHIPAKQGSQLPILDDVLADIGDEQSLEQSLSTFSSHIRRVSEILGKATERSLVMLDELGAGTDPAEGAALGRAILDELDSIGGLAIVTTHIGDLKTYAFGNPRAENAAVEFDIETLRPLYHLRIGDIGQSNALQIARRLELAEHLVIRAGEYLERTRGDQLPEWEVIQKLRKEAEESRQAALAAQAEAQRTKEALDQKLADLQRQTENDTRISEARARIQPGDRVVVPRFGYDRPGRVVKLDPKKSMASVAIGSMKWDVPISELIPQMIRTPEAPAAPGKPAAVARPGPRLEDFRDEP